MKKKTKKQTPPAFKNIDEVLNGLMDFALKMQEIAKRK